jgi:hypothetical protein
MVNVVKVWQVLLILAKPGIMHVLIAVNSRHQSQLTTISIKLAGNHHLAQLSQVSQGFISMPSIQTKTVSLRVTWETLAHASIYCLIT